MYFVTIKRDGYILFCTTPSERAALGLTEAHEVHLFTRASVGDPWQPLAQWSAGECSHTDFMLKLHHVDEPAQPEDLLAYAPAGARRDTR